jgi:hypothetical protein
MMKSIKFPDVSGRNLKRQKFVFPEDFPAKYTIVLMAFYRHHQNDVDTWIPFVGQKENDYEDLTYIELPVIYKMSPIGQFLLNEGMRAGIPDRNAREKTITLYLDKPDFLDSLDIDSEDEIQILLVEEGGEVLWKETGVFSAGKGSALEKTLQKYLPISNRTTV